MQQPIRGVDQVVVPAVAKAPKYFTKLAKKWIFQKAMGHRRIELSYIYPYHVYARSNHRDWFELPLNLIFDLYGEVFERTIEK